MLTYRTFYDRRPADTGVKDLTLIRAVVDA